MHIFHSKGKKGTTIEYNMLCKEIINENYVEIIIGLFLTYTIYIIINSTNKTYTYKRSGKYVMHKFQEMEIRLLLLLVLIIMIKGLAMAFIFLR